jgi:MEMO1 family protein
MGHIVFGAVVPHPPIIIEEVGGEERLKAEQTIQALESLSLDLVESQPDTLVLISPHGPVFEDGIVILGNEQLAGNFANFGAPQVKLAYTTNLDLAEAIVARAKEKDIFAVVSRSEDQSLGIRQILDHGAAVPLSFFQTAGFNGKIVLMGMAMFPPDELYEFGVAIQQAVEESGERVAIIASGDLSHRLTEDAPAGYNPKGKEFDELLVERIKLGDFAGIMDIDPELAEEAGECGYRPVNMLLGCFDGYNLETRVYSYQGPFGVGYLVAGLKPLDKSGGTGKYIKAYRLQREQRLEKLHATRHPIVKLAAASLEHFLRQGEYLEDYAPLPEDFPSRAGVFVSLKKHGNLRGCIGTTAATQKNLAREVINNAISAGTEDPRFFPVEFSELPELTISVDILGEEEQISSLAQLDPQRYGVIVRSGNRSGLLLPNLEGIDTAAEQVKIARQKAGIGINETVQLSRFEVKRYY